MRPISEILAKPGDSKRQKFNALIAWLQAFIRERQIQSHDSRVRLIQTSSGVSVIAEDSAVAESWSWQISITANMEATIGLGTLNALVPTIDGVRLDAATPPQLLITEGPNEQLRSWIAIQVKVNPDTHQIDPAVEDSVTIIHTNDLAKARQQGDGIRPLAMLIWRDSQTIQEAHQIARLDLQHRYEPATKTMPATHLFWPG